MTKEWSNYYEKKIMSCYETQNSDLCHLRQLTIVNTVSSATMWHESKYWFITGRLERPAVDKLIAHVILCNNKVGLTTQRVITVCYQHFVYDWVLKITRLKAWTPVWSLQRFCICFVVLYSLIFICCKHK